MKFLTVFLCGLLFSTPCFSGEPIKFVAMAELYPFSYEENGIIKGYDYDIVMEVMKRAGITISVELLPAKRAWSYLVSGDADGAFVVTWTKPREKYIQFSDVPVHSGSFYLFVLKGLEFPFHGIPDLYGKRVGYQYGFSVNPEFDKAVSDRRIILDEALTVEMNLKKLLAKRVDCFISSTRLINPFIRQMKLDDQITYLPAPILPERHYYLVLSKKGTAIKDKDGFLKTFSAIRMQLDRDGTVQRLEGTYFPTLPGRAKVFIPGQESPHP